MIVSVMFVGSSFLVSVCSAVFCTRVAWVCLLSCKEEGSSPVPATTERRDMGLYEVPLSMSLL